MKVPFSNLYLQHKPLKRDINTALENVIRTSAFSGGYFVEKFEKEFARYFNNSYCLGVNSGTSALHLALWSLGIGKEDEVIIPTFTFFATAEAISLTGATPVFVDSEEITYNIDPNKIEPSITSKTKAVIAVHLYGRPAKIDEIRRICQKKKIYLIEDCAQSHLSYYKNKAVGTFGTIGCFSFYPGKNLGTFGEAGAIITQNKQLYNRIRALRNHGSIKKYYHDYIGHNYRMDGLQAAILSIKLKKLIKWNKRRIEIANLYTKNFTGVKSIKINIPENNVMHTYHLYVIQTNQRIELIKYLQKNGIETGIHYPLPCHLQKAYKYLGYKKGDFPKAESFSSKVLSLPMYPELKNDEVIYVANTIKKFYSKKL